MLLRLPTRVGTAGRLTHEQFWVLGTICRAGSMTMGELAAARDVALNTATAHADRLVQAGLVERRQLASDRRVVIVAPTTAGESLYRDLADARARSLAEMLEGLTAEDLDSLAQALPALTRLAQPPPGGVP